MNLNDVVAAQVLQLVAAQVLQLPDMGGMDAALTWRVGVLAEVA